MPGGMWPSNLKLTGLPVCVPLTCAVRASQCNEGFYTSQADGLVHGEGDCVRCPPGARRGRVPPSHMVTAPLCLQAHIHMYG